MHVKQSMSPAMPRKLRLMAWLCAGSLVVVPCAGLAGDGKGGRSATASIRGERVPSGVRITPTAAPGALFEPLHPDLPTRPDFIAGQAVTTAISPDGTTLLILTSGYNRNAGADGAGIPEVSNEYIFVYDITGKHPVKRQVLQVPNTFVGLAWHPNGQEFYVSGGPDDNVHVYHVQGAAWAEAAVIPLGHAKSGPTDLGGLSVGNKPNAAGIAVNTSGTFLVVANHENDSISVVDVRSRTKVGELDLRPGKINAADEGQPGGAYPFWVAIKGETKVYITSQRDRQWDYTALVPEVLRTTQLPLPPRTAQNSLPLTKRVLAFAQPRGDAASWEDLMAGQNFAKEDKLDEPRFNRDLWAGLKGTPYPTTRHGHDLSKGRQRLLKAASPAVK